MPDPPSKKRKSKAACTIHRSSGSPGGGYPHPPMGDPASPRGGSAAYCTCTRDQRRFLRGDAASPLRNKTSPRFSGVFVIVRARQRNQRAGSFRGAKGVEFPQTFFLMEAHVNRIRRLRLGAGGANEIGEWDAVVVVEGAEVSVRFARKPPDAVREFLRRNGFKWNATEKEWRCQAEPMEVESQEERRRALAGDFSTVLDMLSQRRQAASQAAEGLVRELLQALEGLRVAVFRGEWVEIHMPDVPRPQESDSGWREAEANDDASQNG
jgi:hypothetical protein